MKALILVYDGYEEAELIVPADIMKRAGIDVFVCSMTGKNSIVSAKGFEIQADGIFDNINVEPECFDLVMLPGGGTNSFALRDDDRVIEVIKDFCEKGKIVSAICAAPIVLEKAGLLKEKDVTSYTGILDITKCNYHGELKVVRDGNIITARGPGASFEFGYALAEALCGREMSEKLKKEMLF